MSFANSRTCVAPVGSRERLPLRGPLAQDGVADVEDRVRPGALCEVLDDLAHTLVAVDEDHVAGTQAPPQRLQVVPEEMVVTPPRLGEHARRRSEDPLAQPTEHP